MTFTGWGPALLCARPNRQASVESATSKDYIGREHAADVLPSTVGQVTAARGAEERTAWRQPIDLIALCEQAALGLPRFFVTRKSSGWSDDALLAESLLADVAVTRQIKSHCAVQQGARCFYRLTGGNLLMADPLQRLTDGICESEA